MEDVLHHNVKFWALIVTLSREVAKFVGREVESSLHPIWVFPLASHSYSIGFNWCSYLLMPQKSPKSNWKGNGESCEKFLMEGRLKRGRVCTWCDSRWFLAHGLNEV